MSPAELLWSDPVVYRRRREKTVAALIAVQRILLGDRSRVPEAEEFLELYEWFSRIEPEYFARVWSDPTAYYWVRRAVHFLAGCRGTPLGAIERAYCAELGADGPLGALRIHLGEFKRFVLALGVISGRDVAFAEPYETSLPLAVAGTRFALVGSARAIIRGIVNGGIEVLNPRRLLRLPKAADREKTEGLRVEACPTVVVGDVCVSLNPAVFNLPGLGFSGGWTALPLEFQSQHCELVAQALCAIRRVQPLTFSHFEDAVRAVALKPPRAGGFGSISASELPGAFVCSVPCDAYELAATFVHEFHHNRLFFIEDTGPLFEAGEEDAIEGEIHYSPWRDGPRPLHGLLHALYVYLPVFRFWAALLREGMIEGARLAYAKDQVGRLSFQLRIGASQLRRHARLTQLGSLLFEQMSHEVDETEREAQSLSVTLETPAMSLRADGGFRPVVRDGDARPLTVGETLLDHLERSDLRGECAEKKALLAAALGTSCASRAR